MGTMKPRRPFSTFFTHQVGGEDEHHVRTAELRRVLRGVRDLTRRLEDAMTHKPLALIGVVAGGSFALGVLVGSRLARAMLVAGVGFACGAARARPTRVVPIRKRSPTP
jgi:hypothetical protein